MDTNDHSNDTVGENPSVEVGDNPTENEPMSNSQEIEATETIPSEPLISEDEIKIANLTTTVASQSTEIAELNARLVACQQHYETILARQKDDYSREKQSTVMRYAQAEKAKLDSDKRCDTLLAKNADLTKEKENLQMKLSEFKLMNTKLQQAHDNKAAELNTMRKELEKVKELNQSIDATLKSTLNHLKGESQQLREQRELNERLKRDLNEQREINEQLNSQCKQLTETVQAVPTDDERTQAFDTLLNEHNSLKSQLAIVQEENNRFLEKLKSATEDHVALENVIENFRINAVRDKETNKKLYDDLLAAREQDAIEISRLKQIENLHNQTLADNADLRQLLEKEHQHLELTQKLTEKNSVLQTNYEQLEIVHKNISEHHDNLKKINEEQHNRIAQLENAETSLRDQLKDLEEKYGNLSKSHEDIVKKYDDSLIEIQTLKKKHQANTKDLIKQLQQLQKTKATAHDDGSSPALQTSQTRNIPAKENLGDHSSGRGSPTGSYSSLNDMTPPVLVSTSDQPSVTSSANNHHHHQQQQQQQQQLVPADDEQEVVVSIVDIDRQKLIEKLLKQQKLLVRRNEKIEFLNDHIQLLTQDLQNKRKIIQAYAMNADGFMYTSNESDLAKQQLANKTRTNSASTSLMATLYNRATTTATTAGSNSTANKFFDQSAPMTLETSLDIMGKLQSVLEDTLLKNITLKENVDTLSKEIEKLSKRTRK